jgi:UDP-N-acetylmuramate: L-alanyl-gamma-D-glutamyl-meso-diaminopimelate ligase
MTWTRALFVSGSGERLAGDHLVGGGGISRGDAVKFHLIGICGTGMATLAGLLEEAGHEVRGSDKEAFPPMSDQLRMLDIPIMVGYGPKNLDWDPDVVVVGNVCRKDHVEVAEARRRSIEMSSMAATLEERFLVDRLPIIVAGTHGKTTSGSLLAHLLDTAGREPGFFIGGIPQNFGRSFRLGSGREFVVEGDEYDTAFFDKKSKFLHYRPSHVLLTGIEFDHADIFESVEEIHDAFRELVALIPPSGLLVAHSDVPEGVIEVARCKVVRYRIETEWEGEARADWAAGNDVGHEGSSPEIDAVIDERESSAAALEPERQADGGGSPVGEVSGVDGAASSPGEDGHWTGRIIGGADSRSTVFQLFAPGSKHVGTFRQVLSGRHNALNAVGCMLVGNALGLDWHQMSRGLISFRGVQRRQEIKGVATGVTVIDDFAHHPTAVRETLDGLKRRFAGRRLIVAFEPRSATSRRKVFQKAFADALSYADAVVVAPVYNPDALAADERLDPELLVADIRSNGTPARYIDSLDEIVDHLTERTRPGDIVVMMSSGSFGNIHRKLLFAIGDAITPATLADAPDLDEFLAKLDLTPANLRKHIDEFLVLRGNQELVGCVALESRGRAGLIKAMAVVPERRGEGLGWMLAQSAVDRAREKGLSHLYMFGVETTLKTGQMLGFEPHPLDDVEEEMAASPEFERPLHVSGELMRLDLDPEP